MRLGLIHEDNIRNKPTIFVVVGSQALETKNRIKKYIDLHRTGTHNVIVIPHDFEGTEPGDDHEIYTYYENQLGVEFYLTEKISLDHVFFKDFGKPMDNFTEYHFDENTKFTGRKCESGFGKSKVFCDKPFNHNYIHPDGRIRLCCTTKQNLYTENKYNLFNAGEHTVTDYWNSARMKEVRRRMIAGEKIKDCERCYQQEQQGVQSLRSTDDMEEYIRDTLPDGTYTKPATTMQIQMGNICNLKCKMCSQMYSHMHGMETLEIGKQDPDWLHWVREQGANVNNWTNDLGRKEEWYKNPETKQKMFDHISKNIQQLVVIGGEPTLIPEFYELFEVCEREGTLGDKDITLVTNLTNTNPRMTQWLPKLKSWSIWASVDGIKERTEYIRYPSRWDKVLESLEFYKQNLGTNGKITLSPAVQLLNIDQLDDIIKWWKDWCGGELNGQFGWTWLATVWYPLICNPSIAPREWRLRVADKLSKYQFDHFYENIIKNLREDKHTEEQYTELQKSFIKYNDRQDQFRQVPHTWRQLLPDLEKALTRSA
jgi:MoaA/NifB/PqqE/SkfB family radical SAM enzyme